MSPASGIHDWVSGWRDQADHSATDWDVGWIHAEVTRLTM